jgi:hypothetical protein
MSSGHLKQQAKGGVELHQVLGEADTATLLEIRRILDCERDIAYAGGISVDGRTIYIDRQLRAEVLDGRVYVRGMTPTQIITAWGRRHEVGEWAIEMGDNPSDTYQSSHGFATAHEEQFVRALGVNPDRYEKCISDGLRRCQERFIALGNQANPPTDLWCGPYLDDPDDDDKKILRILRARGVKDAFLKGKASVRYGMGVRECRDCSMFGDKDVHPDLRRCEAVSGLVRDNRWCCLWAAKKGKS